MVEPITRKLITLREALPVRPVYLYRALSIPKDEVLQLDNVQTWLSTTYNLEWLYRYIISQFGGLTDDNYSVLLFIKITRPDVHVFMTDICGLNEKEIVIVSPGSFKIISETLLDLETINETTAKSRIIECEFIPDNTNLDKRPFLESLKLN